MSETYEGILDQEPGVLEAMSSSAFAPMVLPVLFILVPIIVSVVTGVILNVEFPTVQPGVYGWLNLLVWYPIEIWYVIKKYQEAVNNSWLSLRYWVGKIPFTNDFLILKWEIMGKVGFGETAAAVDPKFGVGEKIEKPESTAAGDYIVEYTFRDKHFPKMIVAQKDIPERMLSLVGNAGLVQNGGLLFTSRHVASASFVRTSFKSSDTIPFIPIGVFDDCAQIAQDIREKHELLIPDKAAVNEASKIQDGHYASQLYRQLKDANAMIENMKRQILDIDKLADDRAGAAIREARKAGQIPIGPGNELPRFRGMPGTRNQWIFAGVLIFITALIWWRLASH
jgi:hypothetical protein